MWSPGNEDNHFVNMDYCKNVVHIMPSVEIVVNYSTGMMRAKKACLLYSEKIDFKELIQLRLAEKSDQRRMFITTVDSASFHELKQDQSLNVTFAGFMDNLVRMLKDCQAGKLELCLTAKDSAQNSTECLDYHLQFVEIRAFKNLVHLCLPCRSAPLHTVLFYMNTMLDATHKKTYLLEQNSQQLQLELNASQTHIEQLAAENSKLRDVLAENTRHLENKNSAELQQMQDKLAKLNEQRSNDLERSRRTNSGLQAQLDRAIQDKADLKVLQEQTEKRNQTLNEELACCKSRVCTLKEQNEKLHGDLASTRKQERKLEHKIEDLKQHSAELQDHIQRSQKENANVAAELEAEKKILHTKRQALEMASDEIAKANQIILKQNQELLNQKKTIAWRTDVALQQEKAIKEKEKLLCLREEEIKHARITINQLREEIPQQLESMRKFAQSLEQKYTNQILILKERLTGCDKENYSSKANSARRK